MLQYANLNWVDLCMCSNMHTGLNPQFLCNKKMTSQKDDDSTTDVRTNMNFIMLLKMTMLNCRFMK